MEFVGHPLTGAMLHNVAKTALTDCTEIRAAVPYAQHGVYEILLLDDCKRSKKKLTFYGRDDTTTPISTKVLKWFLDYKSPNLSCRLVPHWLHAKVIWWVDSGVYIGSANLTNRAWFENFEAGLYISHTEIEQAGLTPELEAFFNGLDERSQDLTDEDLKFHLELEKRREKLLAQLRELETDAQNNHPTLKNTQSAITVDSRKTAERRSATFRKEWNHTLQNIRNIARRAALPENRPNWMAADIPEGVQADQFLHAYYYKSVKPHLEKDAYAREFEKHRRNPEAALTQALAWWKHAEYDYEHEKERVDVVCKRLRELMAKDRILALTQAEWLEALSGVYAFREHVIKMGNSDLGLGTAPGSEAKYARMAERLYSERSLSGRFSAIQVVNHVIWGPGDVADRIWQADSADRAFKVRHLGKSFYGELVGWARPDEYPPRNSRSSKALRCLGYDVKIYG